MCLLKVKIRILWKIFEVILKGLGLKRQHASLFIFWEAWYWGSQLKLRRLLIPFITFEFAELFTFYVKISQVWALPEVRFKKKKKTENNWGYLECGKIFYWNKIPVITYCAAVTRSRGGKGRGVEAIWHGAVTLWEPVKFSSSWQVSAKCLGNQ